MKRAVVSDPHHEREADRTAARVLTGPKPHAAVRVSPLAHTAKPGDVPPLGPGATLAEAVRLPLESRFGHDFSRVRVHTAGPGAAFAARAFTAGEHIVFSPGEYHPETGPGARLLAHELTHVLQQRFSAAGAVQRQTDPEMAAEAGRFIKAQIDYFDVLVEPYKLPKPPQIDEDGARQLLKKCQDMLTKGLDIIRLQLGNDPAQIAALTRGYQNAVRTLVPVAAKQLQQTQHDIYQKFRDIIDPVAYPPVAAEATADELTAQLTAAEQTRMTVITNALNIANLEDLFSTKVATTTIPLPEGVTTRFASGIPAGLQHGLQNVAGQIIPTPLVLNSTMTLALNLEPYGGDFASYRFTYVEHHPPKAKPTQEVLIEKLGTIGVEGLSPAQVATNQKKFDAHGFTRGSGWSDAEFENVLAAMAQIPDSLLTPVDGITWNRDHVDATDPATAGHYDPDKHEITMFDLAFGASLTRFGVPGQGVDTETIRAIEHEVGHATDLLPLRQAWASLEAAQSARDTAFAQFEDPPGSKNYKFPSSEQASWNALSAKITAAEHARDAARSGSGFKWAPDATGTFTTVEGGTKANSNAFRLAALKDSGARVTKYANKDWGEYFAEAFSLYISDPKTLERLRPNVYAFFVKNHPK